MSEAAVVLATLFVLAMMGIGLAVVVRGAREQSGRSNAWPNWPPNKLS